MTELAGMAQQDYQPWPVFWARADDARLVGAMLHWRDPQDLICTEGVFHIPQRRRLSEDRFLAQILVPQPVPLPGAWTSIASNWADGKNYYHWITDGLTRLQIRAHLPEETRILLPADNPPYIGETMELLGLSDLVRRAPAPCIRPERFYFCSPGAMTGVWNPMGFQWLRDQFRPFFSQPASGPPVFLTRRGGNRVPENLHEIETLFSRHGFEIVDCGKMSVREQIRSTSSAPAIAGFHGAAMTNLLWANPGTPVLEIFTPGYLNACYEQISFHGGLRHTALIMNHPSDHQGLHEWCGEIR
jgi:capsular polysaccharide biosynthesis protein